MKVLLKEFKKSISDLEQLRQKESTIFQKRMIMFSTLLFNEKRPD